MGSPEIVRAAVGWAESDLSDSAVADSGVVDLESKLAAFVALRFSMLPTQQPDAYRRWRRKEELQVDPGKAYSEGA
jgi:hypothetical protein